MKRHWLYYTSLAALMLPEQLLAANAAEPPSAWSKVLFIVLLAFVAKKAFDRRNSSALPSKPAAAKLPTHSCYRERSAVMHAPADIEAEGNFDFEIVGESNYQQAIERVLPPQPAVEGKVRIYTLATIATEDDNEYDDKAVVVAIDRRTVGYLCRDDARRYRRWRKKHGAPDPATCRCVIVGGGMKDYGIWLDTPFGHA